MNEHMGLFAISRYLNSLGLKTSHNKPFERRSIEYIIQNPTYCGMIRWNRTTENETNRIKDKDEWIIEGCTNLLSQKNYSTLHKNALSPYQPRGARPSCTYKHWLSGLIKCPACGRTMIVQQVQKKSYRGTLCVLHLLWLLQRGKCNAKNSVSSLKLEPAVLSALKSVLDSRELCFEK